MSREILFEIFLDLHKAYDALYYGCCLDTIVAYRVGPWALRLLRRYWDHLSMVVWAGIYFGSPFKGQLSVTQGDPLSLTIFNVVVDAVLQHWVSVLT